MNGLAFIAALLIVLTGLGLVWLIANAILDDLRFAACATPQAVVIRKVDVQLEKVGDPVHATSSIEARIALTVERDSHVMQLSEIFINSEPVVRQRLDELKRRSGQRSELLLCDHFPSRFALDMPMPWKGLAALLAAFVVLVLPAGGAMVHYLKTKGQHGA